MIDLHCDTIMMLIDHPEKGDLYKNPWKIDIQKLQTGGSQLQDFALFVDLGETADAYGRYEAMRAVFNENMERYSDYIKLVTSYEGLRACRTAGQIGALLSVEEGGVFEGDLTKLEKAYADGVRLVTISWNYPNGLSFPHGEEHEGKGLTAKGREFVGFMDSAGIIVDVSHLNDAGTKEVAAICRKPFVASHSNARALVPHTRNLSDELIRLIADKGGIIGLNFSRTFLGTSEESLISDIVRHAEYIRNLGGIEVLALGTDFDGIAPYTEIKDASEMPRLYEAFIAAGFTAEEADGIFWKNADRLLQEIL